MQPERLSYAIIILSHFQVIVHGECKSEIQFNCGRRLVNHEALIVNGYESKEGDWPWHASILHIDTNLNIQYKCGGTLLNSIAILTAAHCVYENGRPLVPDRVLIQLGRHNLKLAGVHSQEIEVIAKDFYMKKKTINPCEQHRSTKHSLITDSMQQVWQTISQSFD